MSHAEKSSDGVRLNAVVTGVVQGVGFRYRTMLKAQDLQLLGEARNLDDGSVSVIAEGPSRRVRALLEWLRSSEAPGRVEGVEESISAAQGSFSSFRTH